MEASMMNNDTKSLMVLLCPAEDVRDQWIAHCLDVDVVTQGNDCSHAKKMIVDAIRMIYNRDSLRSYRSAPQEDWDRLRMSMVKQRDELFETRVLDDSEVELVFVTAA